MTRRSDASGAGAGRRRHPAGCDAVLHPVAGPAGMRWPACWGQSHAAAGREPAAAMKPLLETFKAAHDAAGQLSGQTPDR
jgi:hypothetical protein